MGISEAADRADTFVAHKFEEQLVDLGEIRMNYVAEGDPASPALLLIPAQGESWWGYENAITLLANEFRVFAIDLRGQGRSTWTPGRYNLNTWGNDVERFIDLVIGRPTLVAGNSSGGVIAAWLAAYGKPGQIRGAMLEDAPLFSSQAAPPYGPGIMQTLGPIFALWAKWLGPQWSVGDWDGMVAAAPRELPEFLHPGIAFLFGDGTGEGAAATPPQHLKEYDPEWARAWVTDVANAGCDHATMLAQNRVPVLLTHHFHLTDPDTGRLMGAMTDIQARQARRLLAATGRPVTFTSLDAPHTMHDPEPDQYFELLIEWASGLD
ncbi:alpha/beta hydrolase [Nocardia brasiliensis]|uniref:alpha/beta hydrolase n=1 Tax=Nocardia brasiliensis TaxID=37326 RepID=UPI0004A6C8FB|nr:alpha/beta hydrolase [Nocardia brasiliensis]